MWAWLLSLAGLARRALGWVVGTRPSPAIRLGGTAPQPDPPDTHTLHPAPPPWHDGHPTPMPWHDGKPALTPSHDGEPALAPSHAAPWHDRERRSLAGPAAASPWATGTSQPWPAADADPSLDDARRTTAASNPSAPMPPRVAETNARQGWSALDDSRASVPDNSDQVWPGRHSAPIDERGPAVGTPSDDSPTPPPRPAMTAESASTARPHPGTARPHPDTARPRPDTARPNPDTARPHPEAVAPQRNTTRPHRDTAGSPLDNAWPRSDAAPPQSEAAGPQAASPHGRRPEPHRPRLDPGAPGMGIWPSLPRHSHPLGTTDPASAMDRQPHPLPSGERTTPPEDPAAQWPQLLDDSELWTPSAATTDERRTRRLDREQEGRPWSG